MYDIRYDPRVFDDLKSLDQSWQKRILSQIAKKLTTAPSDYGKPLRHALKGYWRLRVNDYRVIYEIDSNRPLVTIWHIGQRKDELVYIDFLRRLTK